MHGPCGPVIDTRAMQLFSTLADTLAQHLLKPQASQRSAAVARIRGAMLELLPTDGADLEADRIRRRLILASDATSLWFLRVTLCQHLTGSQGEHAAMEQIDSLAPLFKGAIPHAIQGRRSPLR